MTLKCWIIVFEHDHGADAWPVFSVSPPDAIKEVIDEIGQEDYDDNKDKYHIERRGPWEIPESVEQKLSGSSGSGLQSDTRSRTG